MAWLWAFLAWRLRDKKLRGIYAATKADDASIFSDFSLCALAGVWFLFLPKCDRVQFDRPRNFDEHINLKAEIARLIYFR